MKIFSWIHRHRVPYNVHSSEVSLVQDGSSVRRSGSSIRKSGIEKEPLLEDDVKADWDQLDGILTIGTLAIDPLDAVNLQGEEGDDREAEESYNQYDHHDGYKNATLLKEDHPKSDIEMCKMYVHKLRDVVKRCNNEIEDVEEEIMYEKLTTLEKRVTLLDLFLADALDEQVEEKENLADVYVQVEDDEDQAKAIKKKKKKPILYNKLPAALGGKKDFSSKPKKLVTDHDATTIDGDIRPLKKLHRFMTRMMKKKIHPDMEARLQKKGQGKLNDGVSMGIDVHGSTNDQYAANESVSLLPTQGIMV